MVQPDQKTTISLDLERSRMSVVMLSKYSCHTYCAYMNVSVRNFVFVSGMLSGS